MPVTKQTCLFRRDAVYTLEQVKARGFGDQALRTARRRGLRIRRWGTKSVVLGHELIAYIETLPLVGGPQLTDDEIDELCEGGE